MEKVTEEAQPSVLPICDSCTHPLDYVFWRVDNGTRNWNETLQKYEWDDSLPNGENVCPYCGEVVSEEVDEAIEELTN